MRATSLAIRSLDTMKPIVITVRISIIGSSGILGSIGQIGTFRPTRTGG